MSKQFSDLGISAPICKALSELKIVTPTEIQQKAIPLLLANKTDVVGLAKTGTGKTAAFGLPLIQLIDTNKAHVQAVILVPTRELGQQIFTNLEAFSQFLPDVSIAATCGGIPIKPQIERLTNPTHIVVATPGRLIDLIQRKAVSLKETKFLVLDEADEMVSILKEGSAIRTAVIFFYLSNEGISILENSAHLGLPIPKALKNVLETISKEDEDDESQ